MVPRDEAAKRFARYYDPFVSAAYACALTNRVKLGLGVIILPYRSPLVTAKATASLDQLSKGRVILGVGPGYLAAEFEALGANFGDRGLITDEYLRAMKALWTNPVAHFDGKYVRFSDVLLDPRPIQQPHPPIWVGGTSKRAIRRAVALGDGWQPNFNWGMGHEELGQHIRELREEIARQARTHPLTVSIRATWVRITDIPAGMRPDYLNGRRVPMTGTPEEIIEDIVLYQGLGVNHVVVDFRTVSSPEAYLEAMAFFMQQIAAKVN